MTKSKELVEFPFNNERKEEIRTNRENDPISKYYTSRQVDETVANFLNGMKDIDHKSIQDNMYPQLWKVMREAVIDIMDDIAVVMEIRTEKILKEILEKEKTDPVLPVEERPIQDPEDKEKGLLFIDKVEEPEELKQQMQPNIPDVNIKEDFPADLNKKFVIKKAFENTIEKVELSDPEKELYLEEVNNNELLAECIEKRTIDMDTLNDLMMNIMESTSNEFVNVFVWEVFEMPDQIRQMMNAYKEMMDQAQKYSKPNMDENYVFINPEYADADLDSPEKIVELIISESDKAFNDVKKLLEPVATQTAFIQDAFEDIRKFLIENGTLGEAIEIGKMPHEDFDQLAVDMCNIVVAVYQFTNNSNIDNDFIAQNGEYIKQSAFTILNLFFPHNIRKTDEELEAEGIPVQE